MDKILNVHKLPAFILLQIFFLFLLPLQAENSSEIRVGIFSFEPMNFVDENGKAQGLYQST